MVRYIVIVIDLSLVIILIVSDHGCVHDGHDHLVPDLNALQLLWPLLPHDCDPLLQK